MEIRAVRRSDREVRVFQNEDYLMRTLGGQLVAWELSEFPGPWWGLRIETLPRQDGTDRFGPFFDTPDGKRAGPVAIRPKPRPPSGEWLRRYRKFDSRPPLPKR